jgi:hypothetical protein
VHSNSRQPDSSLRSPPGVLQRTMDPAAGLPQLYYPQDPLRAGLTHLKDHATPQHPLETALKQVRPQPRGDAARLASAAGAQRGGPRTPNVSLTRVAPVLRAAG